MNNHTRKSIKPLDNNRANQSTPDGLRITHRTRACTPIGHSLANQRLRIDRLLEKLEFVNRQFLSDIKRVTTFRLKVTYDQLTIGQYLGSSGLG